jgi:hypothetical protein
MSTFKDIFLKLIEEDNVAGGAISAFGPGVATGGGIYDPGAGRIASNDSIYAPGDARMPKALGGVQRRSGISKKNRKKRKKK